MLRRILVSLFIIAYSAVQAGSAPVDVLVLTGGRVIDPASESHVRANGYGREFIAQLMQDAAFSYAIESQPFARALKNLDSSANAVLFPMLRSEEREPQYQWIGLLAKRQYYLYRLEQRKDIAIQSLEDAKLYRTGVMRGDVRADYLRGQGFVERSEKGLEVVNSATSLLKMQQAGRIDFTVFSDEGLKMACEEAKIDCDGFTPAFRIEIVGNLWLAASPRMPAAMVNTLRKSFQRQVDSGYLGKLMKSGRPVGG